MATISSPGGSVIGRTSFGAHSTLILCPYMYVTIAILSVLKKVSVRGPKCYKLHLLNCSGYRKVPARIRETASIKASPLPLILRMHSMLTPYKSVVGLIVKQESPF